MVAGIQAVTDSGLDFSKEDPYRCGAIIGSGIGGFNEFEEQQRRLMAGGPGKISPSLIPKLMSNAPPRNLSIPHGLCGPTTPTPPTTAPHPEGIGAARAMQMALRDAHVNPDEIDYINAHGTSTELGDAAETLAVKRVFGSQAKRVAISSTKSMIGHLLGASGGVELIATVLSIVHGVVHPPINYLTPDPACDLDYVPNTAPEMRVRLAISYSFGFGGDQVRPS